MVQSPRSFTHIGALNWAFINLTSSCFGRVLLLTSSMRGIASRIWANLSAAVTPPQCSSGPPAGYDGCRRRVLSLVRMVRFLPAQLEAQGSPGTLWLDGVPSCTCGTGRLTCLPGAGGRRQLSSGPVLWPAGTGALLCHEHAVPVKCG